MTFNISIISRYGLWQMCDHRLSSNTNDDSLKHVRFHAKDGKGLLTYSGIGSVEGQDISKWVRKLLRGEERNIEEHMHLLLAASNKHLTEICQKNPAVCPHTFSLVAYIAEQPVMIIITNRKNQENSEINDNFSIAKYVLSAERSVRINSEGSGAYHIERQWLDSAAIRKIQRLAGKSSLGAHVASSLARLNKRVSHLDSQVSPGCIVSSLSSPTAEFKKWDFNNENVSNKLVQDVGGRVDITGVLEILMPHIQNKILASGKEALSNLDIEEMNTLLKSGKWSPTAKFGK